MGKKRSCHEMEQCLSICLMVGRDMEVLRKENYGHSQGKVGEGT